MLGCGPEMGYKDKVVGSLLGQGVLQGLMINDDVDNGDNILMCYVSGNKFTNCNNSSSNCQSLVLV